MIKKVFIITFSAVLFCNYIKAQGIYGFANSNYSGISSVILNPANAFGTCKFDLTMGANAGYITNYMGIKNSFLFIDFNKDSILKGSPTKFINGNALRKLVSSSRIIMPSFLVKINNKSSMAFQWSIRNYMNINSMDNELANILYHHLKIPPLYGKTGSASNISVSAHMWAEYGITYARELLDNVHQNLTIGTTIKFLQGIQSFYAYAKNFNYTLLSDSTMDINAFIEYGHSKNFSINPLTAGYGMNGKPALGFDIGANYFIKSEKYSNEIIDYILKLSVSIVDIGSIKYNKDNVNDFNAKVNAWNVKNLIFDYQQAIQDLDDTIRKRFNFINGSTTYKMKLPTALILQSDWRLSEKMFINFTLRDPMNKTSVSKENFYLSLSPRIESIKDFSFSMPIYYFPMYRNTSLSKFSLGFIIQLGWITVGTNHLSNLIFNEYSSALDFFMLLKFSSFKREPKRYDADKDGTDDKQDMCPEIAGKVELMGCPDKDNDGVADKDDKCPELSGKLNLQGCPDKDNDEIIDTEDNCPDNAGIKELQGCPDIDNDSIADKDDKCPGIKGKKEYQGCPPPIIDGQILLTENLKEPATNIKVYLIKQTCEKQDSTITDAKGYFKFEIKDTSQIYFVKINENEGIVKGKARFFMAKNDIIVRVSKNFPCNKYVFTQLPYEKYPFIDLKRDGPIHISGNFLIVGNTTEALKNTKIVIRNSAGDIVDTVQTNEFGSFTFKYLDYDQNYLITFVENDLHLPPGTKIILTNKNGKEIKSFTYTPGEPFKYELLSYDKVVLKELVIEEEELNIIIRGYLKNHYFKP